MLQSFTASTRPEQGPPRLEALRAQLAVEGLDGFLVPRADAHQGEYVSERDSRLAWLTGFTGSAGFAIVLPQIAGVFIDGRYRLQVRAQVAAEFTPVHWPETSPADWLRAQARDGAVIGFDPWLHTVEEISKIEAGLQGSGITLRAVANPIDAIWADQPAAPSEKAFAHPVELAGLSSAEKRARLAEGLRAQGVGSAVLTLPDSLCWLLNIRGGDVARNPVLQGFAILGEDGRVDLFATPSKFSPELREILGAEILIQPVEEFERALAGLSGRVLIDRASAPVAVSALVRSGAGEVVWGDDPCRLPKACKTPSEIAATRTAHLRDGAAMVEFLYWVSQQAKAVLAGETVTEIDVVKSLEAFRRATNQLHDLSFETICGAGPNGAIVHYRVTEDTNRTLTPNSLLLVDSGGQYFDGTTDITRTIAIGTPPEGAVESFTAVLSGMISISRARFPQGLAGRDLDALARAELWMQGKDYDHGTGHGVGAFLSVHEGPQRLSRASEVPLRAGMILSNEPGYYREGAYGIRIENLIVVTEAAPMTGGDARAMFDFETLTFAPIDRNLIDPSRLSQGARDWLNAYHAVVLDKIGPKVSPEAAAWLAEACRPI